MSQWYERHFGGVVSIIMTGKFDNLSVWISCCQRRSQQTKMNNTNLRLKKHHLHIYSWILYTIVICATEVYSDWPTEKYLLKEIFELLCMWPWFTSTCYLKIYILETWKLPQTCLRFRQHAFPLFLCSTIYYTLPTCVSEQSRPFFHALLPMMWFLIWNLEYVISFSSLKFPPERLSSEPCNIKGNQRLGCTSVPLFVHTCNHL